MKRRLWGAMHWYTVGKWQKHFNGVAAHIFDEVGRPSLPITFEPLHQYFNGYEVIYLDITDFPETLLPHGCEKDEIAEGRHIVSERYIFIFADKRLGAERYRFTVAHEWGHVLQQFDGEFKAEMEAIPDADARLDIIELSANAFAATYLMPTRHLIASIRELPMRELPNDISARIIAPLFRVSKQAMEIRLKTFAQQ